MPSRILLFDDEEISRESGQQETSSAIPECSTPPTTNGGKTKDIVLLQQPSAFTTESVIRWTDQARIQYFARDLRASSRLPGYAFCAITCLVLLVSTMMLIKNKDSSAFLFKVMTDGYHYIIPWKETAAVVFGAVGLGLSCIILMCHFDTMMLPRLWESLFVDGSIYEMILLRILLVIWSVGLYFCTSSFAVGNVQLNVFFSSWLSFISLLYTYDQWRIAAGYLSYWRNTEEFPSYWNRAKSNKSGTAFNLVIVSFSSLVCFLSITELFFSSVTLEHTKIYDKISLQQWITSLSISGGTFFISAAFLVAMKLDSYFSCVKSNVLQHLACYFQGIVLSVMAGFWAWAVFFQSNSAFYGIRGITNIYFSTWATFFFSCFAFSTWLSGANKDW